MTRPVFTPPADGSEPDQNEAYVAELQRVIDALYDHTEDRVDTHNHQKAQVTGLEPALRRVAGSARIRPGHAPWAWTTVAAGAPDAVPALDQDSAISLQNVAGLGECAVVTNADRLIAPREAVAVHPGRVYVAFFAARRLQNSENISGAGMRFALERLGADYASQGSVVLEDRTLWVDDGVWRGAFTFAVGAPALGSVDAELASATVHVRPFVRCYGLDSVEAVAQVQVLDVTEAALIDGAMDARALEQALADAKAAVTTANDARDVALANATALDMTSAQIQTALTAAAAHLHLGDFGALGDGTTDDQPAIQAAIDTAHAMGGATILGAPGAEYAFTGRILVKQFVGIDLGDEPVGARMLALSDQGGVDLLAGSSFRGWLRASGANDEIGLLGVRGPVMPERPREGAVQIHYKAFLDRASGHSAGSIGLHIDCGDDALGQSINWTRGFVTVAGFDYGVKLQAKDARGWNSNVLGGDIRDFVYGLDIDVERDCALNRIELQFQTGGGNRARRAFNAPDRFSRNTIGLYVWDWNTQSIDPVDNAMVYFGPGSNGNVVYGFVGASPDESVEIVDASSPARPNRLQNIVASRTTGVSQPILPLHRQIAGQQNDHLAFAHRRYTVTSGGATPFLGGNINSLFTPGSIASVNDATEATVTIDMGSDASWSCLGVDFDSSAITVHRCRIEVSGDGSAWETVAQAGTNGAGVSRVVARTQTNTIASNGDRFVRFAFERDTPGDLRVRQIFGMSNNNDIVRGGGAFPFREEPDIIRHVNVIPRGTTIHENDGYLIGGVMAVNKDGLHVDGKRVVSERQPDIGAPSANVWALKDAVDQLRAVLETHGLTEAPMLGPNLVPGEAYAVGNGQASYDPATNVFDLTRGVGASNAGLARFPSEPGQTYRYDVEVLPDSPHPAECNVGSNGLNGALGAAIEPGTREMRIGVATSDFIYVAPRSNGHTAKVFVHSVRRVLEP